ncbi:enoyl-CoA hydratase [Nocardioides insulae]|uniref:enoyl-CoA hydratase n=1 Tax=Nocardioides insulae TaxID=394734 RepID=UPI000400FB2C|nr:enoyl-CoA hydratase [Nocardioides insulae]
MSDILLVERRDGVATVTLNRPEARNALSADLIAQLGETLSALDADDSVGAVVLTGADPAFCAGLDLKQLGSDGSNLGGGGQERDGRAGTHLPWPEMSTPVIGAINGVAVTGGFELALNCDILIASERARFADTHARVGILPGWGLSVLLPLAVGRSLARQMSLTGDFLDAERALRAGLVSEVVPHEELLPTAHRVAATIAANERDAVLALLASYKAIEEAQIGEGYAVEAATSKAWMERAFDRSQVEARRAAIIDRGREQTRA